MSQFNVEQQKKRVIHINQKRRNVGIGLPDIPIYATRSV